MRELAELNEEHRICGMYHTHSGPGLIGGPVWDLWRLFQGLDPRWMGVNYAIGHATVEGGYGGADRQLPVGQGLHERNCSQ